MKVVRLDMNEMPYLPPARIIEAAREGLSDLNRYADAQDLLYLRECLAEYTGTPAEQIVLSPGSDLLLREIIHAFSRERQVVTVSPSFLPTVQIADRFAPRRLSLRLSPPDFKLDPELLVRATAKLSLLIIDNPNNPTGQILVSCESVAAVAEREEILVVIDEAYFEFSGVTCAELVSEHPNLCIVRTLDKAFGLAGARVGYAIAGETFQEALSTLWVFLPQPSLRAAIEALRDPGYMRRNVQQIIANRAWLRRALSESGAYVYPSHANFLLVKANVPDVAVRLRELQVRVSDVSNQLPPGHIRVSVGTREEVESFMNAYTQIVGRSHNKERET
ncbi:MAG: pyridoxal phosphate-dependent aminotransferase [Anaerolineae bacterium]